MLGTKNYEIIDLRTIGIVSAYSAEQAIEYFCWIKGISEMDGEFFRAKETEEIAEYYCEAHDWTKPESIAEALNRSYITWIENLLGVSFDDICDTPEIREKLEADGWERHEEKDDLFGLSVSYTKGDKRINL